MGPELKFRTSGKAVFNGSNHLPSLRGLKKIPTVSFQGNWPIPNQPNECRRHIVSIKHAVVNSYFMINRVIPLFIF